MRPTPATAATSPKHYSQQSVVNEKSTVSANYMGCDQLGFLSMQGLGNSMGPDMLLHAPSPRPSLYSGKTRRPQV